MGEKTDRDYIDVFPVTCSQGAGLRKSSAMTGAAIGLDIVTDFLIISIPARILYQVRIAPRHKFGIGAFLFLSIFMIIIACIRISGFRVHGSYGYTWQAFWMEFEACTAVIMVSLTAFRSLFVAEGSRRSEEKRGRAWYSSSVARLRRGKRSDGAERDLESLPKIPGASLTGMRTFIRGPQPDLEYEMLSDYKPTRNSDRGVYVTEDVSWQVLEVSAADFLSLIC